MAHGKGSKREIRPGVWELRVSLGRDPVTSRYRQVSRTITTKAAGTTRKTSNVGVREAEQALAELVAEAATMRPATDGTVAALMDRWLDHAARTLSPTTLAEYRRLVDRRIAPAIGAIRLRDLTAADLDGLYGALLDDGLAAISVHHVHAVIRRALSQATAWDWVSRNVATLATPPAARAKRTAPPTIDAVEVVLTDIAARDPDLAVVFWVAAATGARRGELCGLRWSDVDLAAGRLAIVRAVIGQNSTTTVKATKTHGRRTVALDPRTVEALRVHRARMVERADACDVELADDGFVFSREPDGSTPLPPDALTRAWRAATKRTGVTARLHDLRHLHASMLLQAGVSVVAVAGRLGHAQVSTTANVYAHVLEGQDDEAAATFGRLVGHPPAIDA
jgi:integrase